MADYCYLILGLLSWTLFVYLRCLLFPQPTLTVLSVSDSPSPPRRHSLFTTRPRLSIRFTPTRCSEISWRFALCIPAKGRYEHPPRDASFFSLAISFRKGQLCAGFNRSVIAPRRYQKPQSTRRVYTVMTSFSVSVSSLFSFFFCRHLMSSFQLARPLLSPPASRWPTLIVLLLELPSPILSPQVALASDHGWSVSSSGCHQ